MPNLARPPEQGFSRLYARNFGLVWSVLRAMGVAVAEREDVAQEVWTLAYRKRALCRPDASERAWLAALARGVALRHRRTTRRRERKHSALAAAATPNDNVPARRVDDSRTAASILRGMPPSQRLAYVLVHAHGMSGREVAVATGVPVATVYSRLRLAKRHVQGFLASQQPEPANPMSPPSRKCADARRRIWAALAVSLPRASAVAGAFGALKVAALGMLLGGAGAGVAHGMQPQPTAGSAHGSAASAPHEPRPRERAMPSRSVADAGPAVQAVDPRSHLAPAATPKRRAPTRTRVRRAAPGGSSDAEASPSTPRLAEEAELLRRAKAELRRGAPGEALQRLDRHALEFADSPLADVREALRVRALVDAGDRRRAEAAAHRFEAAFPDSPATVPRR